MIESDTRPPPAGLWMAVGGCAALMVATSVLLLAGTGKNGIVAALQVTARLAFLFFWPAYVGSAALALFGPIFVSVRQRAREIGLAFAAVMVVHLGLVAWLCAIGYAPGLATFLIFGIAAACIYLIALFSIAPLQQWLGPKSWLLLRSVGMNYVALAFALDFLRDPTRGGLKHLILYAPFAALAIAGPALRLAAFIKRMRLSSHRLIDP